MANFSCLAAAAAAGARRRRLGRLDQLGLSGAPRVRVLVGAQRHDSVDARAALPGAGRPDRGGRRRPGAHRRRRPARGAGRMRPTIVCLQAGNLHSGAFDPFGRGDRGRARPRRVGARRRRLRAVGRRRRTRIGTWSPATSDADSWATDAHKTLNVPYDCGIAIVADPRCAAGRARRARELLDRRRRPATRWRRCPRCRAGRAACRCGRRCARSGRTGVAELVDGLIGNARPSRPPSLTIAGAEVLNDVDYTQVCVGDRRRRADPRGRRTAGGRRRDLDVGFALAGTRRSSASRSATGRPTTRTSRVSVDALRRAIESTAKAGLSVAFVWAHNLNRISCAFLAHKRTLPLGGPASMRGRANSPRSADEVGGRLPRPHGHIRSPI